jgi:hypothetical protein
LTHGRPLSNRINRSFLWAQGTLAGGIAAGLLVDALTPPFAVQPGVAIKLLLVAGALLGAHMAALLIAPLQQFLYYRVWLGVGLRGAQRLDGGGWLARSLLRLFDLPYEGWILDSAQDQGAGSSGRAFPLYVQREHLTGWYWRRRLRPWAFALLVLHGPQSITRRRDQDGERIQLRVDLTAEQYGIYNSAGKRFVTNTLSEAAATRPRNPDPVHAYLMDVTGSTGDALTIGGDGGPVRWASAGALAVARWRGDEWFVLSFRGVDPKGWNLANGGSESASEWTDLAALGFRELSEEMIVLNRSPLDEDGTPRTVVHRPFRFNIMDADSVLRRRLNSSTFVEEHHRIRNAQDGISIREPASDSGLLVNVVPTEFSVRVLDASPLRRADHVQANLILCVNPAEAGIECITAYRFTLAHDDYIVFGEVLESVRTVAREPVMLLKRGFVESVFAANGGSLGNSVDDRERKVLRRIPAGQYHLFDADVAIRIRRLRMLATELDVTCPGGSPTGRDWADLLSRLASQPRPSKGNRALEEARLHAWWLAEYGDMFTAVGAPGADITAETAGVGLRLLPASWKTLELVCQHELLG